MQRSYVRKMLLSSLVLICVAMVPVFASAKARVARARATSAELVKTGQPAPSFSVRTLEGTAYSNASLGGSPTLLQFWTTACAGCRADQVALDELDSKFAGQGLVVLAIDEGEAAETVQKYLHEHPRTVRIVLDERKELGRRFGSRSNPYYVLIDRQGRIAATQRGAAGQQGLMSLLKQAGLQQPQPPQTSTRAAVQEVGPAKDATKEAKRDQAQGGSQSENQAANKGAGQGEKTQNAEGKPGEKAAEEPPKPSGMKVIDIPPDKNSHPGQPLPKAVFVLTNGERLESDRYTMDTKFLHVAVNGEERIVPMNSVDVKATDTANRARGVELRIPSSKSEVFVSF